MQNDTYKKPAADAIKQPAKSKPLISQESKSHRSTRYLSRKNISILIDEHGALYLDPLRKQKGARLDEAFYLQLYSQEIQAAQDVVHILMVLSTRITEILAGRDVYQTPQYQWNEFNRCIEAAIMSMSLINDPALSIPSSN